MIEIVMVEHGRRGTWVPKICGSQTMKRFISDYSLVVAIGVLSEDQQFNNSHSPNYLLPRIVLSAK